MKPLVPALFFAALGAAYLLRAQESEALSPPKAEVVEEPGGEDAVDPAEPADPADPADPAMEEEVAQPEPAEPAMEEEPAQPAPAAEPEPETTSDSETGPRRGMAGEVPETRRAARWH